MRSSIACCTIFGVNAAYAFGNGVFLRRSAEQAKRAAVVQLKSRLDGLSGEVVFKKEKREQVERMVALIEDYQEGAFLPFTRHPLFGAIALPTGGTGLVFLLEYLATIFFFFCVRWTAVYNANTADGWGRGDHD